MTADTVHEPRRSLWPLMLAAIALALLPRLPIVFAARADLFGPALPGAPRVCIGEEITRGDLALELVRGPLLDLTDYQYAPFFGGATVSGIAAAPFFAVFGPKLWALKLSAVALHLLALVAGIALLDRFATRRSAQFFALFFALTPPGYTLLTTVAWGCHVESGLMALVGLLVWLDLRDSLPNSLARDLRRFAFGVVAGFSVWFHYECLIYLAVIFCMDAIRERGFWRPRELLVQSAGTMLGLLPWWIYNLRYDWSGLSIYGVPLTEHLGADHQGPGVASRLADLVVRAWPESYFMADFAGLPGRTWNALALAGMVAAALVPWFVGSRPRSRPFLAAWLYIGWFTLAYAISDFEVGVPPEEVGSWRYLMLPLPFLAIAAACGLDELSKRGAWMRRAAIGAAVLWCALALTTNQRFVDPARAFADTDISGGSSNHLGRWMAIRFAGETDVLRKLCSRVMEKREPSEQAEFFSGMAAVLRHRARPSPTQTPHEAALTSEYAAARRWLAANAPEPYRAQFAE